MQGRLENEMKIFKTADALMESMPSFANEWYYSLKASNKAASSCYDYVRKIKKFLEYISNDIKNMEPKEITHQACESYLISCQTKKDRDGMEVFTSISFRMATWHSLNSFLEFLVKNNYISHNYMKDIEKPKDDKLTESKRSIQILTQNDLRKILLTAKENSDYMDGILGNRDVLIILLFIITGMKKTAMSEINLEDINHEEQILKAMNNSSKIDEYNLNEQIINYLDKWLEDRKKLATPDSGDALFLNRNGERLGDDAIYNIVKNTCYRALGKKISPQKLRSSFCSILYKKTGNVEFVKDAMGYSEIQSVKRYVKSDGKEKKKAVKIMSKLLDV